MKFTVVWVPSAERDLADLWNTASDRAKLSAAADAIDLSLAWDPLSQGEGREGTRRILLVDPLAVSFDVEVQDCRVTVLGIWRWP